jgi:hypothetical protein
LRYDLCNTTQSSCLVQFYFTQLLVDLLISSRAFLAWDLRNYHRPEISANRQIIREFIVYVRHGLCSTEKIIIQVIFCGVFFLTMSSGGSHLGLQ